MTILNLIIFCPIKPRVLDFLVGYNIRLLVVPAHQPRTLKPQYHATAFWSFVDGNHVHLSNHCIYLIGGEGEIRTLGGD